jgi:acetoin utilization protein AcuB
MLVEKWMTRAAITIEENESVAAAVRLLKEKQIRRLPVLRKGKLCGIVSDRDLKAASPSVATSLDIWELHALLDKLRVKDVMTKKLLTITPKDTIEKAAMIMMEKKVGGLPVLDENGSLIGILTADDVFRALVEVTGANRQKTRVSLLIPDEAGTIRQVADICRKGGGKIISILTSYMKVPAGMRELIMRIDCPDTEALRTDLAKKFGSVTVTKDQ